MFTKMFSTPSADSIAQRELEDAKRELLKHQASAEFEAKMVEYYKGVVARLSEYTETK